MRQQPEASAPTAASTSIVYPIAFAVHSLLCVVAIAFVLGLPSRAVTTLTRRSTLKAHPATVRSWSCKVDNFDCHVLTTLLGTARHISVFLELHRIVASVYCCLIHSWKLWNALMISSRPTTSCLTSFIQQLLHSIVMVVPHLGVAQVEPNGSTRGIVHPRCRA